MIYMLIMWLLFGLAALLPKLIICIVSLLIAVKLTILIETCVIIRSGITENRKYISAINTITNIVFNLVLVVISVSGSFIGNNLSKILTIIWYVTCELILIPICEAYAYKAVSQASFTKIKKATYIANLLSLFIGVVLLYVIQAVMKGDELVVKPALLTIVITATKLLVNGVRTLKKELRNENESSVEYQ